jgi:hypothetical protein
MVKAALEANIQRFLVLCVIHMFLPLSLALLTDLHRLANFGSLEFSHIGVRGRSCTTLETLFA